MKRKGMGRCCAGDLHRADAAAPPSRVEVVKPGKMGRGGRILLGVLILLLALTAAVILLRLRAYAAGAAYYDSLR